MLVRGAQPAHVHRERGVRSTQEQGASGPAMVEVVGAGGEPNATFARDAGASGLSADGGACSSSQRDSAGQCIGNDQCCEASECATGNAVT